MTIKDWTVALANDRVLQTPATDQLPASLIPTRVEVHNLTTDWQMALAMAWVRGLPSDLCDHMFRNLHDILPT